MTTDQPARIIEILAAVIFELDCRRQDACFLDDRLDVVAMLFLERESLRARHRDNRGKAVDFKSTAHEKVYCQDLSVLEFDIEMAGLRISSDLDPDDSVLAILKDSDEFVFKQVFECMVELEFYHADDDETRIGHSSNSAVLFGSGSYRPSRMSRA